MLSRRFIRSLVVVGLLAGLLPAASSVVLGVGTVVVKATDIGAGWYAADTRAAGIRTFEVGPATPPLGIGSLQLSTMVGASDKVQLFTDAYDGVALADIDGIGYATYRDAASTGNISTVASLNLRIDVTGDGNPDAYMVFEPYQDMGNAAVLTGVWQNWDAYRGGAAKWWINTGAAGCGQNTPCTFAAIVSALPGAAIQEGVNCGPSGVTVPCPGSLGVNQGSGNPQIMSNVDSLYVSVSGDLTTYDFEPEPPCTTVCYVNTATGNDTNGGASTGDAKKTIQAAVNVVSASGRVIVAAGAYGEVVTVSTDGISIEGAQFGNAVGGRSFAGPGESTVTGRVTIQAADVTLDGFSLTNPGTGLGNQQGILIKTAGSGATITNNIISGVGSPALTLFGGAQGIYLENGPDDVSIVGNAITNVQALERSTAGVQIGDSLSPDPSLGILIDDNSISNVKSGWRGGYGIIANNGASTTPAATGFTEVSITDNVIDDIAGGINPDPLYPNRGWAHAIGLEGDTPGVVVTGNVITNVVDANPIPGPDAIAVFFEANSFVGTATVNDNSLAVGSGNGAIVIHPALAGTADGECNWYGSATGPGGVGPGTGSQVSSGVDFTPWQISAGGPCVGPDNTKPIIAGSATPAANGNGWNNTPVTVSFVCSDEVGGSGIVTNTVAGDTLTTDGANQAVTNTGDCIDAVGNVADAATVSGIDIDQTDPVITVPAAIVVDATSPAGAVVVYTASATDALSGVATFGCVPPSGSTFPIGTTIVSCDATDLAGNAATTATFSVTVSDANASKQEVLAEIEAVHPAGNKDWDKKLDKAIEALTKSLAADLWMPDGNHLVTKHGKKVFDEEKKAVKELRDIKNPSLALAAQIESWTNRLVAVDRLLAQIATNEATDSAEIAKANNELAKGDADAAVNDDEKAIDHYKKAWEHANH